MVGKMKFKAGKIKFIVGKMKFMVVEVKFIAGKIKFIVKMKYYDKNTLKFAKNPEVKYL